MVDETRDEIPKADSKKTQVIEALNRMFIIFMRVHPDQTEVQQFLDEKDRIHGLITEI